MRKTSAIKAGLAALGAYALLGIVCSTKSWYHAGDERLSFEESEIALKEGRYYGTALQSAGDPLRSHDSRTWEGFTYEKDEKGRFYLINREYKDPALVSTLIKTTKPARLLAYTLTDSQ